MKLKVNRYSLQIIPENETDEAYIEEVLGLKESDSRTNAVRVAPIGLDHALAYVEIKAKTSGG